MEKDPPLYTSQRIAVPAAFRDIFSHFYTAQNQSTQSVCKTLLPSFQAVLIFSFGKKAIYTSRQGIHLTIDKCLLLGPVKQPIDYTLPAGAEMLAANFQDDAFYRFFGSAMLFDQLPIHPDKLLNENCFTDLWHTLKQIPSSTERIERILSFSQPYLKKKDAIIEQLADYQKNEPGLSSIKMVAQKNHQSERNIQLKHKMQLGYSDKERNRYQRFLKAIELLENRTDDATKVDWFEIINLCGYYDQSQLIHDFKHYLNLSPTKYLKFQQDICRAKPE